MLLTGATTHRLIRRTGNHTTGRSCSYPAELRPVLSVPDQWHCADGSGASTRTGCTPRRPCDCR